MIQHTQDYRRVKRIADANPRGDEIPWKLVVSSDYIYLMEVKDQRDIGVWCLEPYTKQHGAYAIHVAMSPECRGKHAVHSGLDAICWAFENTDCEAIYGHTPTWLRHAQVIPRAVGMEFLGEEDGCKVYLMTRERFSRLKESA